MGLTVVTYGGGEILKNIFNAIAMMMNSRHGGLIQPLMIISISVGTLWAVSRALFTSSAQTFLSQFVLPFIVIIGIFMIPTASVHIEDILKNRSDTVDHVPLLVAKFAELASSIGYQITKAVETTMHVPNDIAYNTTGMIFGADTAMDISRYKITNADLDKNLRMFCRQCILYDLHLGRYSIDELKKTTDLWKFLEDRTSKVRMIKYTPIGGENSKAKTPISEYLSCKDALKKMAPYFEQEKRYYAQLDICKNLPLTFQALTGMQKNAEELISQQLMMNLLGDEYNSNNFSKARAYLQQRNTYQVLGSLASNSLVTLRAVIEALVYAAFIFILPLSVLPGGYKFITTWIGLVLWIQLWPPFYAILNYIMQSVAHGYAETVLHGISETQQGLSFFTSVGLHNLQQDIYALSGFLAASIPFITYAILKGGVSSFVHLAGSMMSPAHSAASTAAAEQTAGNYSFGNTGFGQMSYKSTTGLQANMAPSLSGGFFHENSGVSSAIYSSDEHILKQSNSELRTSLFSDDSISQGLQTSKMNAQSTVDTSQKNYSEGLSTHSRNLADLSSHLANSENYSNGINQREAYDLQESARYFQNTAENWGKQYGLNSKVSMDLLAGVGVDFLGNGAKASTVLGSNKEEALSSANSLLKSEEFQKHFQKLKDISSSEAYGSLDETGKRLVQSCSQSFEQMQSSQHSFQIAQSNLNQLSENATWAEQNSHLIRRSLNQEFINWASNKYADEGGFSRVEEIITKGEIGTQGTLVNDFINHIRNNTPALESPAHYEDPHIMATRTLPKDLSPEKADTLFQDSLSSYKNQFTTHIDEKHDRLSEDFSQRQYNHREQFNQVSSNIQSSLEETKQNFHSESDRSVYTRQLTLAKEEGVLHLNKLASLLNKRGIPLEKIEADTKIAGGFQIKEEPFWMEKEKIR